MDNEAGELVDYLVKDSKTNIVKIVDKGYKNAKKLY